MFFCTVSFVFGGDNRGGRDCQGRGGKKGVPFYFLYRGKKGPRGSDLTTGRGRGTEVFTKLGGAVPW